MCKFKAINLLLLLVLFVGSSCTRAAGETSAIKPVIGINTDIDGDSPEVSKINTQYIDAIGKAGGIPVLLPPMSADDLAQILPKLDGVMMIGGDDYPPSLYKQEKDPAVSIMKSKRSDFDMILAKAVLACKGMPFLGICAGCQALNIASGGSLTQDIPSMKPESKVKHASPNGWKSGFQKHAVMLEKESKLASALGQTSFDVVTSHHQCVDATGEGLTVSARSADGLTEAIESKAGDRFLLGVQWHPERDFGSNQKLFETFVTMAKKFKESPGVR